MGYTLPVLLFVPCESTKESVEGIRMGDKGTIDISRIDRDER